ncbi:hypothetical protein ABC228_13210 [Ornithinibacillus sp. 16A2E]|uniref:Phosphatase n=2 Tax=Ornithinibacillus xuwenensis TaxID=3144668 RepID=A0ABU9XIM4_9BACI
MKKLIASLALGTLLVGGFLFAQDSQPSELAHGEAEPSVFNISSVSLVNVY